MRHATCFVHALAHHAVAHGAMTRAVSVALSALALAAPYPAWAAGADFTWRNPLPQGNPLWGIDFESALVGWAVGDRGAVLRTTDGGETWTDLTDQAALDAGFNELEVVAPGVLVAVTRGGGILRSTDGGENWISVPHPGTQSLRELAFVDGVLTALGNTGEVLRSSDEGMTWTLATGPGGSQLKGQHWFDAQNGIVVGSGVAVVTADGGASWQPLPDVAGAVATQSLDDLDFAGDEGVIVGEFSTWRTHDGGASWEDVSMFANPIYQRRVFMIDADTRIVFTDTEGANVSYTDDDGDTWSAPVMRDDVEGFYDAVRHPAGGFFAVTSAGDLYRGTSDGLGWSNATQAPDGGTRITLEALARRPDGTVFASGGGATGAGDARWLRSDDDGETWVVHETPPSLEIVYAIDFFDDLRGIAGGYTPGGLAVARTLDGGASWSSHDLQSSTGFVTGVAFVDADVAVATLVGEHNGPVERTTDGGATWSLTGTGAERMECVTVAAGDTVYTGGGGLSHVRVFRSTDAGATWTQAASTGLPAGTVHALAFLDGTTGLAATNTFPSGVYRTTDGGESWSQVLSGSSIRTLEGHPGLLVAGGFLRDDFHLSTDTGLTWMPVELPMVRGIESAIVRGDRLLLGGYGSNILEGTVDEVVTVPPGPAGPRPLEVTARPRGQGAHIALTSATTAAVNVALFDVGGRRLRTLFFDTVHAGRTLELDWDGRDRRGELVPSGVVWVLARAEGASVSGRIVRVR